MLQISNPRRHLCLAGVTFAVGIALGFAIARWLDRPSSAEAGPMAGASAEDSLKRLKIELPPASASKNTLAMAVRVGNLLYVSGHGPSRPDGTSIKGCCGADLNTKQGAAAARQVGLNVLSTVRKELGSLDKVVRVVKTLGMVNATADFTQHPQVVNGFSDLMVEVFGDKAGKGARSAVGMVSLPGGIAVEVEAIFEVR